MNKLKSVFVFVLISIFTGCTTTPVQMNEPKLEHNYLSLKLMDIDEMTSLIEEYAQIYRTTDEIQKISEALKINLSRPNEDNIAGRLMLSLRNAVGDADRWDRIQAHLVDESLERLKDQKTAAIDQVTYLMMLQNWLAEVKPELSRSDIDSRSELQLVEKIAAAQVIVSDEAGQETALNLMTKLRSPSLIANDILVQLNQRPAP